MHTFGPVPSRRLGRSLGINNIPAKICSYGCVYCQLGKTIVKRADRREYYNPEEILRDVEERVESAEKEGIKIDYLTFVPDGEPTLDMNLGEEAKILREIGIPLAIISNSSLIWREDVRNDLMNFDYVSLKLDAISEELWKKIDRPHESLEHEKILEGMLEFRKEFRGMLVTETMLVDAVDYDSEIPRIRDFLKELKPDIAHISVPTRPPAEDWVRVPDEAVVNMAFHEFSKVVRAEYLIGYEGNEFASTGNPEDDILAITSVHPMREEAVNELLKKHGRDWKMIDRMVAEGKLIVLDYDGRRYVMRRIASRE
jgi:wyosine [tRNA(Phe)-imidazoG37] synthetase (radical SAM superfamily)